MLTRLISGILLLIILAFAMSNGGIVLYALTLFISLVGFSELVKATNVRKEEKKPSGIEIFGYLGIVAYYIVRYLTDSDTYALLAIILTIMGMMLVYVLTFPKFHAQQVMSAGFSFLYCPVLLSYIYMTRNLTQGIFLVWLIFSASWGCDTCAYAVGKLLGKHKLAPVLSPKKSIEGAVGGVAGAALIGFLYAWGLQKAGVTAISDDAIWAFPLISGVGAVLSQLGDLAASGIKRDHNIKDYGRLIPGHGGIMDRFDSVIVTAPLIYYLCIILLEL